MRMDPTSALTAEEIVNTWSEKDLGDIFREYGEAPHWRAAAREIVQYRKQQPLSTTKQLADLILSLFKGRGKIHPATLIFQALRIVVNRELTAVEEGLSKAISLLSQGGRIGVISFHSLEDRIVKQLFKAASTPLVRVKNKYRQENPVTAVLRLLSKKPLLPSVAEIRRNPRSRSAKLRTAEKL